MRLRLLLPLIMLGMAHLTSARDYLALLGTYTGGDSRGIYAVRLDAETGALSMPELVAELPHPEFLALHPNGGVVYALTRVTESDGGTSGAIASFAVDSTTGRLSALNTESASSGGLTHLAVDATGRMVVAASYGGAQVVSFPIEAGGRLGKRARMLVQAGPPGPNQARQESPHPHSVTISPDDRFAFVADLGVDRVFAYRLAPADGSIEPHMPGHTTVTPGAGPRHTAFSPDGKSFYILNELDGTITSCRYDIAGGVAEPFQRISTSPDDYTGRNSCSEIRMHPSGRFVYAANRGYNGLAVFSRDVETGELARIEIMPGGGETPRNFGLTPDGQWLLCANQNSDNLTVFRIDQETGRLESTGQSVDSPTPVCVLFLP